MGVEDDAQLGVGRNGEQLEQLERAILGSTIFRRGLGEELPREETGVPWVHDDVGSSQYQRCSSHSVIIRHRRGHIVWRGVTLFCSTA